MVAFEGKQYSVPSRLLGETVWVRVHGRGVDERVVLIHVDERVVLIHVNAAGPIEVSRHPRATPGSPQIDDTHFPPGPSWRVGPETVGA